MIPRKRKTAPSAWADGAGRCCKGAARVALRRDLLAETLADPLDALRMSEAIEGEGATIFRHACALGLEGIISKRRNSPYRSGRDHAWRKIKCTDYRRSRGDPS